MTDYLESRSLVEMSREELEICIAATFTSEPIGESLRHDLAALSMRPRLRFAPYKQLIQQLLGQRTDLITSAPGANIFLLRAEDFSSDTLPLAAPVARTSSAGGFGGHKTYVLPNGLEIAHLNSYET